MLIRKIALENTKEYFWWVQLIICLGIATLVSIVFYPFTPYLDVVNIAMVFVLATFMVALRWGNIAGVFSAFINVFFFDFFFVPPFLSLSVQNPKYFSLFGTMLIVGLVTGQLTARLKNQKTEALQKQSIAQSLQEFSRELLAAKNVTEINRSIQNYLEESFRCRINFDVSEKPISKEDLIENYQEHKNNLDSGVRIVYEVDDDLGKAIVSIYFKSSKLGILTATSMKAGLVFRDVENSLKTVANLIALRIIQNQFSEIQEKFKIEIEMERLKSAILSSISHDIRTPLTRIIGIAERIESSMQESDKSHKYDAQEIKKQGRNLSEMVGNLLELAKLQTEGPRIKKEWQLIDDVLGSSIKLFKSSYPGRQIDVEIAKEVPPLEFDGVLIERVICNLLENAAKYSPETSEIKLVAENAHNFVRISVIDAGIGLNPSSSSEKIFEAFTRDDLHGNKDGIGLGLAICREIVYAHDGKLDAQNNLNQKGAKFSFELPIKNIPDYQIQ